MKTILSLLTLITLTMANTAMPEFKKYYISGIEFDTKTYCADFVSVIDAQNKKIKSLETEIAQLRQQLQHHLSEKLKAEHNTQLNKSTAPAAKTKSKIIISDKPL